MMNYINAFLSQLSRMHWQDCLDILLVAYLFYRLMPLLRNRTTMRIFGAVAAVLIIAFLSEAFNFYTLNFVLEKLMTVGILALVILFQPELRRALDRIGNAKLDTLLGLRKEIQEQEPAIRAVVDACETMSREKVGALIVFTRNQPLTDYYKTGTLVDAQVSEQLIRNIFFPKAALHDGAMILEDGRIAAAGCVLPLSNSNRLSADLGTRHRAGVGMSEVTDAIVVIVSEETGTISAAIDGMLKRHLAPKTLEKLLMEELLPEAQEKDSGTMIRLRQKLRGKNHEE